MLGRGSAIYTNSGFDLGPDARVQIGAFTMINGAEIVCDDAIRIGDYGLISWNVVLMDNYRVPCSIEKRRAYIRRHSTKSCTCNRPSDATAKPIVIGDNVWIGHDSVVLPGRADRKRQHRRRALGCG